MGRRINFQHPDAQRAIKKFRLDVVIANMGHCWVMPTEAKQRLVAAVIESRPDANPEKAWEMVEGLWKCEN